MSDNRLSLSAAVAEIGNTHKLRDGTDFEVALPPEIENHFRENGGLLQLPGLPPITVRAPIWRATEGDPKIHTSDLLIVHGLNAATENVRALPNVAHEIEGFAIRIMHKEGELPDIQRVDITKEDDAHPELFGFCYEVATPPTRDMFEAGMLVLEAIRKLQSTMHERGADYVYPGSNIGTEILVADDLNPHPYIQRLASTLGRDNLAWLDRGSVQSHIERIGTLENMAFTFNVMTHCIEPVLSAISASSPFARGERFPIFPTFKNVDHTLGYMATGYFGRMTGSPEAGPAILIAPTNIDDLAKIVDTRMQQDVPNPGRTFGQHSERLRLDLAPYGTIESCTPDTYGLHIETIMSAAAVKRALVHILATSHHTGDIERLAKQYPHVVKTGFEQADVQVSRYNSALISQFGLDIAIRSFNAGEEVQARTVFEQILALAVNEAKGTPFAIPQEAVHWLKKRAIAPQVSNMPVDKRSFTAGTPSTAGYYNGGTGTLSHYMHARVNRLAERNRSLTERSLIAEATADAALAFSGYIKNFNPDKALSFLKS